MPQGERRRSRWVIATDIAGGNRHCWEAGIEVSCSMLQLRPAPSRPTVVRISPRQATGMFSEEPRAPSEMSLRSFLLK